MLSTDHGASFHPLLTVPHGQLLESAGMGTVAGATRILFSFSDAATQRRTTVSYSDDLGTTLKDVTGDLATTGYAIGAQPLTDGRLLLGLSADTKFHFALRESTGTGHWGAPRVS
jgi:hypothetical protein